MSSTHPDPKPIPEEKQHDSPPTSIHNSWPDINHRSGVDGAQAEKGPQAKEPPASPRPMKGILWALVVVAILSSTFLFSLDNTVVAGVQPTIVRQFGSVNKLTWLSVGYLLGSTTTNLLWYAFACLSCQYALALSKNRGANDVFNYNKGVKFTLNSMPNGSTS